MPQETDEERKFRRKAQNAALVIALSFGYWIAAQLLGDRLGWGAAVFFIFDIAAIIALIWALYMVFQVYKARRDGRY